MDFLEWLRRRPQTGLPENMRASVPLLEPTTVEFTLAGSTTCLVDLRNAEIIMEHSPYVVASIDLYREGEFVVTYIEGDDIAPEDAPFIHRAAEHAGIAIRWLEDLS